MSRNPIDRYQRCYAGIELVRYATCGLRHVNGHRFPAYETLAVFFKVRPERINLVLMGWKENALIESTA